MIVILAFGAHFLSWNLESNIIYCTGSGSYVNEF